MNRQLRRAKAACDVWNAAHPVGTEVNLKKDNGEIQETKTRSEAYVCNSGYPVIFLEDVSGYYILERVKYRAGPKPTESAT